MMHNLIKAWDNYKNRKVKIAYRDYWRGLSEKEKGNIIKIETLQSNIDLTEKMIGQWLTRNTIFPVNFKIQSAEDLVHIYLEEYLEIIKGELEKCREDNDS